MENKSSCLKQGEITRPRPQQLYGLRSGKGNNSSLQSGKGNNASKPSGKGNNSSLWSGKEITLHYDQEREITLHYDQKRETTLHYNQASPEVNSYIYTMGMDTSSIYLEVCRPRMPFHPRPSDHEPVSFH